MEAPADAVLRDVVKPPSEIAHDITCPPGAGACRCGCDYSEEAARAGMIEALRWVCDRFLMQGYRLQGVADDIKAKIAELEKP